MSDDVAIDDILEHAESLVPVAVTWITALVRCAAVSSPPLDPEQKGESRARIVSSAKQVVKLLETLFGGWHTAGKAGKEEYPSFTVTRHTLEAHPDALPCITAEWRQDERLPTVLIYGHADVQPADEPDWHTDPFEAELRKDEHGHWRLHGRGTSDDIGGWISHLVAIKAWLDRRGRLPVNVRMLIEHEEEIASPHLRAYLDMFGDFLDVDAMVLTDTANPSVSVPGITDSLRGLTTADLYCACGNEIHRSMAVAGAVNGLTDDDGRPLFALVDTPEGKRRELKEAVVEGDLPDRMRPPAEWAWLQPAITVTATSFRSTTDASIKNAIQPQASLRLRFGSKLESCRRLLEAVIKKPSIPGVAFSTRSVSPTEVELTCRTARDTALHSGLYGSICADPLSLCSSEPGWWSKRPGA